MMKTNNRPKFALVFLAVAGLATGLAACGGPGALPPAASFSSPQLAPASGNGSDSSETPPDAAQAGHTNAWGYVLEDPSGKPMRDILVRLQSWSHGCVKTSAKTAKCPGYLPWKTSTDRKGRFTLRDVPDGDYLLVIGSNDSTDVTNPTVHDHVTFKGGVQRLVAPTLPAVPCVDQDELASLACAALAKPGTTPFPRPAVEQHGSYRLVQLDATSEASCFTAFNAKRTQLHLPVTVEDEWTAEQIREIEEYAETVVTGNRGTQPLPAFSWFDQVGRGGYTCAAWVKEDAWTSAGFLGHVSPLRDPRLIWYGAMWNSTHRYVGGYEGFELDPRTAQDPRNPPWQ